MFFIKLGRKVRGCCGGSHTAGLSGKGVPLGYKEMEGTGGGANSRTDRVLQEPDVRHRNARVGSYHPVKGF